MHGWHIDTQCVQEGWKPGNGEPRVVPIVQSTTFRYDSAEALGDLFDLKTSGDFYTRLSNPTTNAVENKIAALEGGVGALLTSAGQAATMLAVLNIARAGDHIVSASAVYGGTFNLFHRTLRELGIDVTFVEPGVSDEELEAAFRPNTKPVSYTHLRAHETGRNLVCRLLLEKKKGKNSYAVFCLKKKKKRIQ